MMSLRVATACLASSLLLPAMAAPGTASQPPGGVSASAAESFTRRYAERDREGVHCYLFVQESRRWAHVSYAYKWKYNQKWRKGRALLNEYTYGGPRWMQSTVAYFQAKKRHLIDADADSHIKTRRARAGSWKRLGCKQRVKQAPVKRYATSGTETTSKCYLFLKTGRKQARLVEPMAQDRSRWVDYWPRPEPAQGFPWYSNSYDSAFWPRRKALTHKAYGASITVPAVSKATWNRRCT